MEFQSPIGNRQSAISVGFGCGHRAALCYLLLNVREDHEWTQGHIPGAVHLSRGILERDIEAAIPDREAEILLYCGGGYRSALSAENLQKMGYKQVFSVDGGWRGWVDAGFPVEKEDE